MVRSLLLALLVVLAAACARSSSAPSSLPPSAIATPLRAGTSGEYPPISIWRDDRVEGFAPALVAAFAAAQKMEIGWTRFTWPGLSEDLRAGRFDLAADGITVRPERSIGGRFTATMALEVLRQRG